MVVSANARDTNPSTDQLSVTTVLEEGPGQGFLNIKNSAASLFQMTIIDA